MKKLNLFILLLFCFNYTINCQCPNLPTAFPTDPQNLEIANLEIAKCYAPTIHQLAELNQENSAVGRGDLITAVNYDGDWDATNNWENLTNYVDDYTFNYDELDPKVYYSVVWTDIAWIITYGFYHPRDWSLDTGACCGTDGLTDGDNHENDFEGVILVVSRITTEPGIIQNQVVGGYSISHHDLLPYLDINTVPEVFIDNRTHAVELNLPINPLACINSNWSINCDNCTSFVTDHITYTLSYNNDNPFVNAIPSLTSSDYLNGFGKYVLEDIFANNSESLWAQKDNSLVFNGDKFASAGTTDCTQYGGDASAP